MQRVAAAVVWITARHISFNENEQIVGYHFNIQERDCRLFDHTNTVRVDTIMKPSRRNRTRWPTRDVTTTGFKGRYNDTNVHSVVRDVCKRSKNVSIFHCDPNTVSARVSLSLSYTITYFFPSLGRVRHRAPLTVAVINMIYALSTAALVVVGGWRPGERFWFIARNVGRPPSASCRATHIRRTAVLFAKSNDHARSADRSFIREIEWSSSADREAGTLSHVNYGRRQVHAWTCAARSGLVRFKTVGRNGAATVAATWPENGFRGVNRTRFIYGQRTTDR